MSKRDWPDGKDGAAIHRKHQKIVHEVPTGEEVLSSPHLRKLLTFAQDLRQARHGLQSFKLLLDKITAGDGDKSANIDLLVEYLASIKPRDQDGNGVFLSDVMQMWSFAAQIHDEGIMSAVAVVLALLLQITSNSLELLPHALSICKTLLQEQQLKSIARNLSADKSKGFVISPTLRLLREALILDGGVYAKRIMRAREYTLTCLGRNLEIGLAAEDSEDPRKTSVRTHAVRFLLACLKFSSTEGRRELLSQRDIMSHLIYSLKTDSPPLVLETLETLRKDVLGDDKLPRELKFKTFNTKTLVRFLALYNYNCPQEDQQDAVHEQVHQLLLRICTKPGSGILHPSNGLYPKMTEEQETRQTATLVSRSQEEDLWTEVLNDGVPVYNFVLSELAQKLRPWASMKHSQLLVSILETSPELIADYFYNNQSFTFEPKLSMTWVGYAAFLFNTMLIPLPAGFGDQIRYAKTPPPISILLDNIIPSPLNEKVLTRCLSTNSHLTSFFAVRILVTALGKLRDALVMLKAGFRLRNPLWINCAGQLIAAFCQRVPSMKDIVRAYKELPKDNHLHRLMTSRLLQLYYDVIPQVALVANFDASPLLMSTLRDLDSRELKQPELRVLVELELESLVRVASCSPGMRWFSPVENIRKDFNVSPFTALLQLVCEQNRPAASVQMIGLLGNIASEGQIVPTGTKLKPLLRALLHAQRTIVERDMPQIWVFLDNCLNRCATSPIKYLELLADCIRLEEVDHNDGPFPLVAVAIAEQLPYFVSAHKDEDILGSLATFLAYYLCSSALSQESDSLRTSLRKKMAEKIPFDPEHDSLRAALSAITITTDEDSKSSSDNPVKLSEMTSLELQQVLDTPLFTDKIDTSVLTKWATRSPEDLIEDGWIHLLASCLTSAHIHIRKEALVDIRKAAGKVKESQHEEREQLWLLLSELVESSHSVVDAGPAPTALAAFSVHAIEVLTKPLHPLYPKLNSFLTRSPIWPKEKLPLAHDVLHGEPSPDDKYYTELAWLLDYLLDALCSPSDLAVFHKARWFEKIFALASNPYLRPNLRTRILKIIYRATCIEGGSTTLATRFGVFHWLDAQRISREGSADGPLYRPLISRVWDTCDQERVDAWSQGGIRLLVGKPQASTNGDTGS